MTINVWQPNSLEDDPTIEQLINWALQYAILAPSAHNTQPWKWQIEGDALNVFRDPKYTLDSDPTFRETFLGIAAFMENFILAVESQNFDAKLELKAKLNSDLHIAKISVLKSPSAKNSSSLFGSITKRHTNRGEYNPDNLPKDLVTALEKSSGGLAKLFIISESEVKNRISNLVQKGYAIALSMPAMERELAELITSEKEKTDTGMTVEAMYSDAPSLDAKKWLSDKPDPIKESEKIGKKFANSPALIVIGTETDGPAAWVDSGRLMQRALLTAASFGLTHDISAAPIEIPTLSPALRKEIDSNFRPQVLFRIGEPADKEFTKLSARRPVAT